LVAFVDGDVIHPHRVLLRHRRDVGKTHGVAVVEDLAACLRVARRLGIDADILAGEDGDVGLAVFGSS